MIQSRSRAHVIWRRRHALTVLRILSRPLQKIPRRAVRERPVWCSQCHHEHVMYGSTTPEVCENQECGAVGHWTLICPLLQSDWVQGWAPSEKDIRMLRSLHISPE